MVSILVHYLSLQHTTRHCRPTLLAHNGGRHFDVSLSAADSVRPCVGGADIVGLPK